MKRIFISGPYSIGDIEANVKRACDLANTLINLGYAPFCPHLFHYLPHQPYNKWLEIDNAFLEVCAAVIRIPGESVGSDREVQLAEKLGIPVFYSIQELRISGI